MNKGKPSFLAIITARGGSKAIPRKNLQPLLGKPLIAYTIIEALKSQLLSRVILSSDDQEIIDIGEYFGAEAPFVRPAELATDDSPSIDTVKHALSFLEAKEGAKYDYIVLLQPTSPLRIVQDIDNALQKMLDLKADSVITVTEVGRYHPAKMKRLEKDRIVDIFDPSLDFAPKQKLPPLFIRNGALYAAKEEVIWKKNSLRGDDCVASIMPPERSVDIDTRIDFKLAELLMKERVAGSQG